MGSGRGWPSRSDDSDAPARLRIVGRMSSCAVGVFTSLPFSMPGPLRGSECELRCGHGKRGEGASTEELTSWSAIGTTCCCPEPLCGTFPVTADGQHIMHLFNKCNGCWAAQGLVQRVSTCWICLQHKGSPDEERHLDVFLRLLQTKNRRQMGFVSASQVQFQISPQQADCICPASQV